MSNEDQAKLFHDLEWKFNLRDERIDMVRSVQYRRNTKWKVFMRRLEEWLYG